MFAKAPALVVMLLCGAALAACGGGGGSSSNSTPAPILQVVPGPWSGTYSLNNGSQINVAGAISTGGFGYFADSDGNIFMLQSVPNTSPFTSAVIGTAPVGETLAGGDNTITFQVKGTFSSTATATTMQATLTSVDPSTGLATGVNGQFSLKTAAPYSGDVSLSGLQGQWDGYYLAKSSTAMTLNFQGNGVFSGSDANGCTVSGSLVQQAPQTNLFYVNYTASGSGCPGVMNGLGYLGSSDVSGNFSQAAGTYLYLGLFGLKVAYSAELKLQ